VFKRPLTVLAGAGALVVCVLGLALALPIAGCTGGDRSGRNDDEGLPLCRRFADLRNAHDAGAEALLGPAVGVPADPVAPEQAERIDADTFLRRDNLRVVEVRREGSSGQYLLVMEGAAAGEPLQVRSGDKINRSQRVMTNPALVVEVRDGKIHGVRAQLFVK
jgi:hypothetical protein